jgi:hypothetical protein
MSHTETAYNEDTKALFLTINETRYFQLGKADYSTPIEGEVVAQDFTSMVFTANRALSNQELDHLSALIGFLWKTTVKGDRLTNVRRFDEITFVITVDLNSSTSRNPYGRFDEFSSKLNEFLAEGSPVRKDGTQLVEGINDVQLMIWLDEVSQEVEQESTAKLAKLASMPSPFAPELLSGKTTDEISNKVRALVSIKDSLTPGEQDVLTMAHDLLVANADLVAKLAEAEAKLAAVRSALG